MNNNLEKELNNILFEMQAQENVLVDKMKEYQVKFTDLNSKELGEAKETTDQLQELRESIQDVKTDLADYVSRKEQLKSLKEYSEKAEGKEAEVANNIIERREEDLQNFEEVVAKKYEITLEKENESESTNKNNNIVQDALAKNKRKSNFYKALCGALTLGFLASIWFGTKKAKQGESEEILSEEAIVSTDVPVEEETSIDAVIATPEVVVTPEVVETIIDGSEGTFTDVTNDQQVEARANYIYNNYVKEVIDSLGTEGNEYALQINPESIGNMIRVFNDELPIENGVSVYDENTINYYMTLAIKTYGTLMSDERLGYVGFAPMSMLLADNSQAQAVAEVFDEDFEAIADARNNGTHEEQLNSIKEYGYDLRDRVLLFAGLNGELTPMNISEHGNAAYIAAMGRFAPYVLEWNIAEHKAACIEVCTNYDTGNKELWSVAKLYETIEDGSYNNVIARITGSGNTEEAIGTTLYNEQDQILRNKYNQYALTLGN